MQSITSYQLSVATLGAAPFAAMILGVVAPNWVWLVTLVLIGLALANILVSTDQGKVRIHLILSIVIFALGCFGINYTSFQSLLRIVPFAILLVAALFFFEGLRLQALADTPGGRAAGHFRTNQLFILFFIFLCLLLPILERSGELVARLHYAATVSSPLFGFVYYILSTSTWFKELRHPPADEVQEL